MVKNKIKMKLTQKVRANALKTLEMVLMAALVQSN